MYLFAITDHVNNGRGCRLFARTLRICLQRGDAACLLPGLGFSYTVLRGPENIHKSIQHGRGFIEDGPAWQRPSSMPSAPNISGTSVRMVFAPRAHNISLNRAHRRVCGDAGKGRRYRRISYPPLSSQTGTASRRACPAWGRRCASSAPLPPSSSTILTGERNFTRKGSEGVLLQNVHGSIFHPSDSTSTPPALGWRASGEGGAVWKRGRLRSGNNRRDGEMRHSPSMEPETRLGSSAAKALAQSFTQPTVGMIQITVADACAPVRPA